MRVAILMVRRAMVKPNSGGDANNDPKDKNDKEPADDATDKGKGKGKAGDQGDDDDPNEKKFSQSDLDAALARDRQDRRKSQPKVDTSKSKNKKKEENDDDDGETDRQRKRADDAEDELRRRDARDTLEDEARRAGFKNPRKMYRLLKDDLTFDSSGKPENVKDLITIAKRDYADELDPEADPKKPKGSADAGAKGTPAKGSSMNDFIRRGAGRA